MLLPIAFAAVLIYVAVRQRSAANANEMESEHENEGGGECFLLGLPGEILERVLGYLEPEGLVAASQTCRALREVAKSPRLTYSYTLAMRGYIDVANRTPPRLWPTEGDKLEESPFTGVQRATIPTVALARWPEQPPKTTMDVSALSAAEKGRLLHQREARWDRLAPAQVREFAVAGPAGVYELQDGVFLLCHERSAAHEVRPTKIRLIPLPSATDPDLERPILPCKAVDVGFPIADLTMDPSQDLIVVSEHSPARTDNGPAPVHRFHLLTLSDGKPHPLAAQATLDSPPCRRMSDRPSHYVSQQLLQVMDSTLVVLVAVQDEVTATRGAYYEEMVAWNWKTGEVLGRRNLGETLARSSIALLTPTTVAVTMPAVIGPTLREMFGGVPGFLDNQSPVFIHPPSIDIYSFARNPTAPEAARSTAPLKWHTEDDTTPKFVLVTRLLLPPMRSGAMMAIFHMRPDPAFPAVPSSQQTLGARPFTQDPRRGVLVIELAMDDDRLVMPIRNQPEFYEMFILRETLVDMAEEGEERLHEIWARTAAVQSSPKLPDLPDSPGLSGSPSTPRASSPSPSSEASSSPRTPSTPGRGGRRAPSRTPSPEVKRKKTYSAKPRRKHHRDSPTRIFEWDEWGEYSTRVMQPVQNMRRLWVCSCSGYRYASLVRRVANSELITTDVCVLDFNPHWVVRNRLRPEAPEMGLGGGAVASPAASLSEDESGDGAGKAEDKLEDAPGFDTALPGCVVKHMGSSTPSVIKSEVWDYDVVTRLPYRSVSRRLRDNPRGIMMDDQRILIVDHAMRDNDWLGMVQYISTWCM